MLTNYTLRLQTAHVYPAEGLSKDQNVGKRLAQSLPAEFDGVAFAELNCTEADKKLHAACIISKHPKRSKRALKWFKRHCKHLHKALLLSQTKGSAEESQQILDRIAFFLDKLDIMSMWKIVVQVGTLSFL